MTATLTNLFHHCRLSNICSRAEPSQPITDTSIIVGKKQSDLYLVRFEDETLDWATLPPNNPKVIEYAKAIKSKMDSDEKSKVNVCDIGRFCDFDDDPFNTDPSKIVDAEKTAQDKIRKEKVIVHKDRLPKVTYKDGQKYYGNDSSSDEDYVEEAIVPDTKTRLSKHQRIIAAKKAIPTLRTKADIEKDKKRRKEQSEAKKKEKERKRRERESKRKKKSKKSKKKTQPST